MRIRFILLLVIPALCAGIVKAQSLRPSSLPAAMLAQLRDPGLSARLSERYTARPIPVGDIVVGYPNPNEVREINTAMTIAGNIIVLNNGQLRFNNVDVHLQGNIVLLHNGKLEFSGGTVTVAQYSLYQSSFLALNKSALTFRNTAGRFSGFNVSCGLADTTILTLDGASFPEGFMTVAVARDAQVAAAGTTQAGEFLFSDRSRGSFRNCNGVLTWLTAPKGCDMDITLPQQTGLTWLFPDSARRALGMDYRISYEGVFNARWGLMAHSGAKVRVADSDLLACGSYFEGSVAADLAGLANNQRHLFFAFPSADRDVTFSNTLVRVWNIYPADNTNLTLSKSIFGELLALGHATATVTDSYCDGTGGYVGGMDSSRLTLVNTQIAPEVNARNRSFVLLYSCSLPTAPLHTSDNGVMALLNTTFSALPVVTSGSAAIIGSIDEPSSGFVGQKLKVYGTARLVAGSDLPVHLNTHWLEYRTAADPDNRHPITKPSGLTRYRDTLGTWDTQGLSPGNYLLRLNLQLALDAGQYDTIPVERSVRLLEAPLSVHDAAATREFFLSQNYPNPFSSTTTVAFAIPERSFVTLRLYDALGRPVKTLFSGTMEQGSHETVIEGEGLPAGGYFLVLRSGRAILSRGILIGK